MKKLLMVLLAVMLAACTASTNKESVEPPAEEEIRKLPDKEIPDSSLMSESPLSPLNIDNYLFIDDVLYIDTRSPQQFNEEGHVAGFTNIPFYESIATYNDNPESLFEMKKVKGDDGKTNILLGDVGSFFPRYKESEELLEYTFPRDKQIVFIATAGVESCYLINLLKQYGYDASLLYNAGSFTNSLGPNVAYKELDDVKYYVEPIAIYKVASSFDWGELTAIERQ